MSSPPEGAEVVREDRIRYGGGTSSTVDSQSSASVICRVAGNRGVVNRHRPSANDLDTSTKIGRIAADSGVGDIEGAAGDIDTTALVIRIVVNDCNAIKRGIACDMDCPTKVGRVVVAKNDIGCQQVTRSNAHATTGDTVTALERQFFQRQDWHYFGLQKVGRLPTRC